MNRNMWRLLLLILVELLVGGGALAYRAQMPVPPWPVEDGLNKLDRDELQRLYDRARRGASRAWLELARTYAAYGFLPEALVCYAVVTDTFWSRDPQVWFERGVFAGQLGHADEAVLYLERALQLGSATPERVWYFVAQNQMRRERLEEAKAALRRAEPLPAAAYELARLLNKTGQPESALRHLDPLKKAFPYSYPPYFVELRAYQLLGNTEQERRAAIQWFRLASPIHSPFDDLHDEVAQRRGSTAFQRSRQACYQLLEAEKFDELRRELDRLTAMKWTSELADLRAELATKQGRRAEAESLLRDAIRRDGPSLHLLWRLGDVLMETDRADEAWQVWEKAAQVGRGNRELAEFLTYIMLKAEGMKLLDRGRRYDGARWLAEGRLRLARGEFADAHDALAKAITFFPDDPQTWYLYAEAAWGNRQVGEARRGYQTCLQLRPHHGRAQMALELLPE